MASPLPKKEKLTFKLRPAVILYETVGEVIAEQHPLPYNPLLALTLLKRQIPPLAVTEHKQGKCISPPFLHKVLPLAPLQEQWTPNTPNYPLVTPPTNGLLVKPYVLETVGKNLK